MQTGPYIAERLMPRAVADYCAHAGISFQAFSDEWVLRLQKDDVIRWVIGYKFDLNRSAAGELAQDKVATYAALSHAGIPAVEHYLVRSLPHEEIQTNSLTETLGDKPVVAKPLEGTSGREVMAFSSASEALLMIQASGEPAWAVAPHYDLQTEYRVIMLDESVLLTYEKTQPTFRRTLKLFNLSYGAVAKDIVDLKLLNELTDIANRVMKAMALRLAAVDIVRMPDGSLRVLEVNDGISMEHYARQSAEYKERASSVYDVIIAAMLP